MEGELTGAVPGYSKGDPSGTAIIETLLPFMENHRDDLVVFGAWLRYCGGDGGHVHTLYARA